MSEQVNSGLSALTGVPIEDLISQPIIGAAKGQAELAKVTLEFVNDLGFVSDERGKLSAKLIEFEIDRLAVTDGEVGNIKQTVQVPPLTLVNIPNMTIDELNVEFSMEVKMQQSDTSTLGTQAGIETEAHAEVSGSFMGVGAKAGTSTKISGSVSYNSSNTRSSDFAAKYMVTCVARQQPVSEGMAKLTQILASVIEPVQIS